ncbi:hypothetical protein [Succinimonas amylolytica]|uniref:hypothetical protein n=1 Tax=Succinimonas amylolytica TaxID=83769 RepID=UPI0023A7BCE8
MKKLMIAAAAFLMSATAMADWAVVEQTDDGYVFEESNLGVRMATFKVAPSDGTDIGQAAAGIASEKGCQAPTQTTVGGYPGYHFVCPDNIQAILIDDKEDISLIMGKCDSEEQCAAIDSLITMLTKKQ